MTAFGAIAIRDDGLLACFTLNGHDISRRRRHMAKRLGRLPFQRFVLEGELMVLDDDGRISLSWRTIGPKFRKTRRFG